MKKGLLVLLMVGSAAHAGHPVWKIIRKSSAEVSVSASGTATAYYTVTNNSSRLKELVLASDTLVGINIEPATLTAGTLWVAGYSTTDFTLIFDGTRLKSDLMYRPTLCQANWDRSANGLACYTASPGNAVTIRRSQHRATLTASVQSLVLSVNDPTINAALTGNSRQITITNTGATAATGLNISYEALPSGTTVSGTCEGTIEPGTSCTMTITPGDTATSSCNTGIEPTSGTITVSATNVVTAVTINVFVLSYGC
jgi:hypothetical protein